MEINGAGLTIPMQELEVEAAPGESSISIILSEKAPTNIYPWNLQVDVLVERGRVAVGSLQTVPSFFSSITSRVVAIATIPGAQKWFVRPSAALGAAADLDITKGPPGGLSGGLVILGTNGQPLPPTPGRIDTPSAPGLLQQRVVSKGKTRIWFFRGLRSGGVGAQFFQVFDLAAAPGQGALPLISELVLPNSSVNVGPQIGGPLETTAGLTWAISTTPDFYTPSVNSEFWMRTGYD